MIRVCIHLFLAHGVFLVVNHCSCRFGLRLGLGLWFGLRLGLGLWFGLGLGLGLCLWTAALDKLYARLSILPSPASALFVNRHFGVDLVLAHGVLFVVNYRGCGFGCGFGLGLRLAAHFGIWPTLALDLGTQTPNNITTNGLASSCVLTLHAITLLTTIPVAVAEYVTAHSPVVSIFNDIFGNSRLLRCRLGRRSRGCWCAFPTKCIRDTLKEAGFGVEMLCTTDGGLGCKQHRKDQ